jgi:hypothetical protein
MVRKVKHLGDDKELRKLARGELPLSSNFPEHTKELGEVMAYSKSHNSYTVKSRGVAGSARQPAGRLLNDIPKKSDNPGATDALPVGTTVIIEWGLGFPYIDGVLPVNTSRAIVESTIGEDPNAGAVTDNTVQEAGAYYRTAGMPQDVIPGDQGLRSPDGNTIGAGRGGHNYMKSGGKAKAAVETFGTDTDDKVKISGQDFDMFTDFGVLNCYNEDGRCGLKFRAAADQLNQSGGAEEQWTFKLDIGDEGNFFKLEVCSMDGATKSLFHITSGGQVTVMATDGLHLVDGGKTMSHQTYAASLLRKISENLTEVVEGKVIQNYTKDRKTTISEGDQKIVGSDNLSVNANQNVTVGGNRVETITGGSIVSAMPSNVAVQTNVLNGSYILELGNPKMGASPAAMAGITLAVNAGDVTLGQNPSPLATPAAKATVNLNTLLPNSVGLGCSTNILAKNPGLFHAVMYEPLEMVLKFMAALFDSHIHFPPIGGKPLLPMIPTMDPLLRMMMSMRVVIGG